MPLGSTVPSQFLSEVFRLFDGSDVTKKTKFVLSGITSGNVRALTIPDSSGVIALEGHVHPNISVLAGLGLSGGGTLGEDRTLVLDITEFDEDVSPVAATDYLVVYDASASTHKKVLLTNILESVNSFIELGDTPTSYDSADIDKILVVKSDLSGLEFTDSPTFDMLRLENQIQFFPKTLQPLITFIFDDGHDTTLSIAKPVFDAQGEVACSAPISDYIGTGNYLDSIELNTLQNAGWEILSHSKSHIDLTTLSNAEIITELLESKQALEALGLTIRNFVYPFGTSNEIVRRLTRSYYRSARAIGGEGLINAQVLDTFKLRAYNADDHTKLAEYQAQVDIAESGNQWLIFYFHAVDSDDATMLNTLIDYIQAKNIDVVTVNEALDLVGNVIDVGDNFAVNEAGIRANFVQGMVGLGVIPTSTLSIGSYDKVERLDIHHTNVNAHFKTSKGLYLFQTDEGTNTNSYLVVKGKGSGRGYLYAYDEDDAEAIEIRCSLGHGYIRMIGASPGPIHLQDGAHSDVRLFANSAEGETKELRIYGRRTGDDGHQLSIGVGVDAADTASFSNCSNYRFNGIVEATELKVINAINEFSVDGTLDGNSDSAVPTEKAVRTYVDNQVAGVNEFVELTDTPNSYDSADIGKYLRLKDDLSGLEFVTGAGGGEVSFLDLNDTPDNYTGSAGKYAKVNVGEDGLEFDTPAGGGVVSPIGSIVAWHKTFANTPALPSGWVECNGQTLSDAGSVYDGQVIPNLNGDARFLRGNSVSGTEQAATNIPNTYTYAGKLYFPNDNGVTVSDYDSKIDDDNSRFTPAGTQTTSVKTKTARVRVINMSVVWIMRVK